MTLTEHISELRSRLGKALLAIAVATTAVAIWGYNPLIRMLEKPYRSVPADHRAVADGTLIFTHPTDAFVLRLKIALIAGLILSSPIWLYQLWAFVTPGLHRNERKWALAFVSTSVVLFTAGAVVAYLVLPKAMDVLLGVGGPGLAALLEATKYLSFVTSIMLIFGVSFEFPLLIIMLNFAGLLSSRRLRDWRRYAIFTIFAFAAVATPTQDPFTMLALAVPMCLLYEFAALVAWLHDRRAATRAARSELAGLSDDEASPLDLTSEPLEVDLRDEAAPEPVGPHAGADTT
jgi:sec-independent protein translocase protein TatC